MKRNFVLVLVLTLNILGSQTLFAQNTIKVTGHSEYNLSPNEIIIRIAYQEYFTDKEESSESKVAIEDIEKKVLKTINKLKLDEDKITMGGVEIVRPYENRTYLKRRLKKSLIICIENTKQYVDLIRHLESNDLFDQMVVDFNITEYRHTEREDYLNKSREKAFENARQKAELILKNSGRKLGKVLNIAEINNRSGINERANFYQTEQTQTVVSGFQPIVVTYNLEVIFEII